jgi:hypothetical protein
VFFKSEENIFYLKNELCYFFLPTFGFFLLQIIQFFSLKQEKQLIRPHKQKCFSKQKKIVKKSYAIFFLHFGHTEIHTRPTNSSPISELADKFVAHLMSN